MYSKGKGELRRHYRRESHLRRAQIWRFDHLVERDPITKVKTPLVRDKFGNLLKGAALESEIPHFINEELELGPKHPFYEDFIMGRNPTQTSTEMKASSNFPSLQNSCGEVEIYLFSGPFGAELGVFSITN